jgi:hypothetical protein
MTNINNDENIYCYNTINCNGEMPTAVYSTYSKNQELSGNIYIVENAISTKLTKSNGDYEGIRTVTYKDNIYGVCTKYESRKKEILFFDGEKNGKFFSLTPQGKYDNPEIVEYNNKMYIFWENAEETANFIEYVTLNIQTYEISNVVKVTQKEEKAYMPRAISDGENLFLAYEVFFNNRYHIIFRILEKNKTEFSEEIEAGFKTLNDTSISLFKSEGSIYYCFENSSPLYTDYEWISPDNSVITMPSFGHGWRVKASTGIRRIRVENRNVIIEKIVNDSKEVSLVREEGSGEATIFVHKGIIYIAYLEKATHIFWKLMIEYYNDGEFEKIETEEILFDRRTKPIISLGDEIHILNCISENEKKVLKINKAPFAKAEHYKVGYEQHFSEKLDNLKPMIKLENKKRESIWFNGEELGLYWGDLHMHSNISGCSLHKKFHCTEIEQKHRFSKDVGRLDFDLLTDHEGMSDFQWNMTKKYAHLANLDNSFVSFVGFEWTSSMFTNRKNYGHYNVLYKDDGNIRRIHTGEYDTIEKLWASLQKGKALTIPHHPSDEWHPLDWNYFNADFEPLVEIYQVRGSYEHDGCLMQPENYGRTTVENNSVQAGLNKGYKFGFTSGGEHEGVGITGVFAKELTREGIFEALTNRRTYGTTSEKIFIDFRVNGELFGGVINADTNTLEIQINVKGINTIKNLTIVTSLEEVELEINDTSEIQKMIKHTFEIMPEWVYLRMVQVDKNMAWTSPVWVEVK